jgi:hypothetical protein
MSKIPMGSFVGPEGPKGDQGDIGPAGPNTVPTDQAIASAVTTNGTASKAAVAGAIADDKASTSTQTFNGYTRMVNPLGAKATMFGVGNHIPSNRQPFGISLTYDGAKMEAAGGDKVASQLTVLVKGDFTADQTRPGGAPKWFWGANDFIITGTAAGDLNGLTDIWARLTELHLESPGHAHTNVHAFIADIGLGATATGSSVTGWMSSMKAVGPTNNASVPVANSTSLLITSSPAGTATNQYALYVGGGDKSYFTGNIQLENKTVDAGPGVTAFVKSRYFIAAPDSSYVQRAASTVYATGKSAVAMAIVAASGAVASDASLQEWQDFGGVVKASIDPAGRASFNSIKLGSASAPSFDNTDGTGVQILQNAAGNRALRVKAISGATADLTAWLNSGGSVTSRVSKSGHFISNLSSAPALADMADGEFAFYRDSTTGDLKVASRVAGSLKTGTVTVA